MTLRWLLIDQNSDDNQAIAACADIDGLFSDGPQVAKLIGCRPEPPFRRALDSLPGSAVRRRQVHVAVHSVDETGVVSEVIGAGLQGAVTAVSPSDLGDDLLDITFDSAVFGSLPAGARTIWDLWQVGRPTEPRLWLRYDRVLRHHWSGAALAHHRQDSPDRPPSASYHLDGRGITDVESFYCAIGEAINGRGGYFGWNADSLHDITFDQLVTWLTENGVQVDIR
ncbi:barstar family protein [Kribbella sp. NPDC056861]|uniref:barstar family protein n=1 Tax=Kribbella sp. NPDC056861 TaxID=3154857 RepID=UPI00341D53B7